MTTFQKVKIGNICDLQQGLCINRKSKHLLVNKSDLPLLRITDLINNKQEQYIDPNLVSPQFISDEKSLIYTRTGQVGLVFKNKIGVVYNNCFKIIPNDNISKDFLFYLLKQKPFQENIVRIASKAAQPDLTHSAFKSIEITIPDNYAAQTHIASVLSTYDDLIGNNEKRIKALEEMAQLLYVEWFVKFKFPGHEKVKMVDSGTEYGKIPQGWEVKKLSEVASFVRGCSYSSEEINDYRGDYYIVNLKSFNRGGGFRFDGTKYYSGTINNNQMLKAGDIVVAVTDMTTDRAVIARPARVPELAGKITLSADVVKINSDILPSSFMYELLSSYRFTETTKQKANGANVLHLKPSAILEFIAIIPDTELLKAFDVYCKTTINEVDKLLKQNDVLTKTRDLLIPQLVTGKKELK